jgi:hypothetical protein
VPSRWEGDDRGVGVADAAQLVPGGRELLAAFTEPGWVAESPESHLRPHIEAWCRSDGRLELVGTSSDDSQAYVVDLAWRGATPSVGEVRAAVFALVGSFAESATYVRQHRVAGAGDGSMASLRFEVGTGELAPDSRFHPHGHVLVISVTGVG